MTVTKDSPAGPRTCSRATRPETSPPAGRLRLDAGDATLTAIDGDTVVIGAGEDDDKGSNSGSAYVFTRDTAGDLSSPLDAADAIGADTRW